MEEFELVGLIAGKNHKVPLVIEIFQQMGVEVYYFGGILTIIVYIHCLMGQAVFYVLFL